MSMIRVRNLLIGGERPKICIPIIGKSPAELIEKTKKSLDFDPDMYEFRADYFKDIRNPNKLIEILKNIRELIGEAPLIATIRSKEEGGEAALDLEEYLYLNKEIIESKMADIVDLELNRGREVIEGLVDRAGRRETSLLLSFHDFHRSMSKEELISLFVEMQSLPADLIKIAIMTKNERDLLDLFDASLTIKRKYADRPFISIGMGESGVLSRVGGGVFGSSITFAKGVGASAPGQVDAKLTKIFLDEIHGKQVDD